MKPMSNKDFADFVMSAARPASPFQPEAIYDPDGDCIEFVCKSDSFRAERIDDLVTVYYSHESNEVVGSLIKGIKKFCSSFSQKNPGFGIEISSGKVKLSHLFLAQLWSGEKESCEIRTITYKKLIAEAEAADIETDMATV